MSTSKAKLPEDENAKERATAAPEPEESEDGEDGTLTGAASGPQGVDGAALEGNDAESAGAKKKKKKRKPKDKKSNENDSASTQALEPKQTGEGASKDDQKVQQMKLQELLRRMGAADMLAGSSSDASHGSGQPKEMSAYKFWRTQPVPSFDEKAGAEKQGEIKAVDVAKLERIPAEMPGGFEWVTMDLTDEDQLSEVYDLLNGHYVEDHEALFRFSYSRSFLDWALKAPGWMKELHIGVRASESKKLVAFISGIPVAVRVHEKTIRCSEINFLCVHKKLRSKRLAPTLIKEITRRSYVNGIFQGLYTAGTLIPKPISTCRYYHRSLDWEKLYDVGFSPLPPDSTKRRQIARYVLPKETTTTGLRPMTASDAPAVRELLTRYVDRAAIRPEFSLHEIEHWLLNDTARGEEEVIYSYVVEEAGTKRLTDFFSFYGLESTAIKSKTNQKVRAAYLFYYATDAAWSAETTASSEQAPKDDIHDSKQQETLKARLNQLMHDALILAKNANFDVFNALSLLDNPLFLEQQRFGPGDGYLHFYLFNYRAGEVPGGIDPVSNRASEKHMGGVGIVML